LGLLPLGSAFVRVMGLESIPSEDIAAQASLFEYGRENWPENRRLLVEAAATIPVRQLFGPYDSAECRQPNFPDSVHDLFAPGLLG
jgi:hypothetical protein